MEKTTLKIQIFPFEIIVFTTLYAQYVNESTVPKKLVHPQRSKGYMVTYVCSKPLKPQISHCLGPYNRLLELSNEVLYIPEH